MQKNFNQINQLNHLERVIIRVGIKGSWGGDGRWWVGVGPPYPLGPARGTPPTLYIGVVQVTEKFCPKMGQICHFGHFWGGKKTCQNCQKILGKVPERNFSGGGYPPDRSRCPPWSRRGGQHLLLPVHPPDIEPWSSFEEENREEFRNAGGTWMKFEAIHFG